MKTLFSLVCAGAVAMAAVTLSAGQKPAPAPAAPAKMMSANPISDSIRASYEPVKGYIVKAAEQVPENLYSFKPTPEVRSFGQVIGHLAADGYLICANAAGVKSPISDDYQGAMSKAQLQKVLAESVAFCDKAYAALTDKNAPEPRDFFGQKQTRLGVLAANTGHMNEHYGNIVTYMRINKMVPPSSQPRGK